MKTAWSWHLLDPLNTQWQLPMPDLWMRWGSSHFVSFVSGSFWLSGRVEWENKVGWVILYDQFYFRLINDLLWQVLRIDISTITVDRSVVDSALHVCFSSSSLKQLLVITSTSRLMKLDSHNGLLLSEVGTYSSLQFHVENNMGLHRFYFTLNCD